MMLVSHAIIGTAIGAAVGSPAAGFVIGVASHFVADATPHFDPGTFMQPGDETYSLSTWIWASVDVAAALIVTYLIVVNRVNPTAVAWGAIGAMLPDILLNTPFWKDSTRLIPGLKFISEKIHQGWHWTVPPKDWFAGVLTQVIAIGGSFWVLAIAR